MTVPLISVEDVRALLNLRPNNTSFDARLARIIGAVTNQIQAHCRRDFERKVHNEFHTSRNAYNRAYNFAGSSYDGLDGGTTLVVREQIIMLRSAPVDVNEPFTVLYDPSRRFTPETEVPTENYFVDADAARIILKYPTNYAPAALKLTYTAGYAVNEGTLSASIPDDLKQAVMMQVLHTFNREDIANVGAEDNDMESGRVPVQAGGLIREAVALLAPYRRILTGKL
jgi:hypothetical protein